MVVVNDGSPASYNSIFKKLRNVPPFLYHPSNQGKGQALKNAFTHIDTLGTIWDSSYSRCGMVNTTYGIFSRGAKAQENPNQLNSGSSFFSGKVPLRSAFGNKVTRFLFQRTDWYFCDRYSDRTSWLYNQYDSIYVGN